MSTNQENTPIPHTPGPWLVKEGHLSMIHAAHAEIAYDVENPADARLIAAAPELLACLKEAAQFIPEACYDLEGRIDSAIAKAEGRAE